MIPRVSRPLIIAHRGASGYRPEHSAAAYQLAIAQGADFLETDILFSRDGRLVCRHDCELTGSTDVSAHGQFASRKTAKTIDGARQEGWFIEDFTLAELRTLRARQPIPFRDHSFDGQFPLLTLEELLHLAAIPCPTTGRRVGLIIEIKHATYFQSLGFSMADALRRALSEFAGAGGPIPLAVESFEIDILKQLRGQLDCPLYQLIDLPENQPADVALAGGRLLYRDMLTPGGLREIATYANGISVNKDVFAPRNPADPASTDDAARSLVQTAHALGLSVHAWTFRNEPWFLPRQYHGNPALEYQYFATLGVDAVITDFPDTALSAVERPL